MTDMRSKINSEFYPTNHDQHELMFQLIDGDASKYGCCQAGEGVAHIAETNSLPEEREVQRVPAEE
jgi:hypothetical protein